ncbi:hypothetical protein LRC484719_40140 [Mycobacterium riyadhense]
MEVRRETKLAAVAEAKQALATARERCRRCRTAELERLTGDMPMLWQAPTTSNKDRKRLLRTLSEGITLLSETIGTKCERGSAGTPAPLTRSPSPALPISAPPNAAPRPAVAMVTHLGPTTPPPNSPNFSTPPG